MLIYNEPFKAYLIKFFKRCKVDITMWQLLYQEATIIHMQVRPVQKTHKEPLQTAS